MTSTHRVWVCTALLAVAIGVTLPAPALPQTYVRGGVLMEWADDTRFADRDCESKTPAALYGCGLGNDGAPLSAIGGLGTIPGLEFGLGYAIKPSLRLEAAIQYRPDFTFDGQANFAGGVLDDPSVSQDVTAELSTLSGMLAAYLDIGELLLLHYAPYGPFIGVGGGLSWIEIGETRMNFPKTSTLVPGGDHLSLSWMLTAGLSISISPRLMLDVGWRYTDHGRVETGRGEGQVVSQEGNRELLKLDLSETKAYLRSHGLNVSLRYAF